VCGLSRRRASWLRPVRSLCGNRLGDQPSLSELFGKGHLAITFDLTAANQRYQGVVPLEGGSLSDAVEIYFAQSEQVPTLIRTAVAADGKPNLAGGLLVRAPRRRRRRGRAASPAHGSPGMGTRRRPRAFGGAARSWSMPTCRSRVSCGDCSTKSPKCECRLRCPDARCRCSIVHFEEVLARFPKEDRRDMRDENGIILVDCAFCSREFAIED
jgi:molecular chaperone Hsp33